MVFPEKYVEIIQSLCSNPLYLTKQEISEAIYYLKDERFLGAGGIALEIYNVCTFVLLKPTLHCPMGNRDVFLRLGDISTAFYC